MYGGSVDEVTGGTVYMFDGPFVGYDDAAFSIFGRNLLFDGSTITGVLEDGSPINVSVQLFDRATVRLVAVPEPGGAALLVLGLVGLGVTGRRIRPRGAHGERMQSNAPHETSARSCGGLRGAHAAAESFCSRSSSFAAARASRSPAVRAGCS